MFGPSHCASKVSHGHTGQPGRRRIVQLPDVKPPMYYSDARINAIVSKSFNAEAGGYLYRSAGKRRSTRLVCQQQSGRCVRNPTHGAAARVKVKEVVTSWNAGNRMMVICDGNLPNEGARGLSTRRGSAGNDVGLGTSGTASPCCGNV